MITKKVLLDAICDLDNDLFALTARVNELEKELRLKAGRKPGRPRKNSK